MINWELPRGWVSYLILIYSVVGILALLLVHPLKEESAKSWVKVFQNFLLHAYSIIGFIVCSDFTRILEYGYTEPRYFVLLLVIWLTTVVFILFLQKTTIKFVPISIVYLRCICIDFPYVNAFSTAKRSQKQNYNKF